VGTIVDVVVRVHQANVRDPIPGFLCPVGIGSIVRISSKTGTEVEKATVRDGVLVIISGKVLVHLPPESGECQNVGKNRAWKNLPSTAYRFYCQPRSLGIKDSLGKRKPRWLARRRILEVGLSSSHGSHSPKSLIIVTHGLGPIRGHHIVVLSDLPLYPCLDNVVV
jgi:hypothetical protein